MGRKQLRGEGWSFTPADAPSREKPIVSLPPARQRARLALEKRGKGKTVTVLQDVILAPVDMRALARELKSLCGGGGTHGPTHVEIQGDHRSKLRSWLQEKGWTLR